MILSDPSTLQILLPKWSWCMESGCLVIGCCASSGWWGSALYQDNCFNGDHIGFAPLIMTVSRYLLSFFRIVLLYSDFYNTLILTTTIRWGYGEVNTKRAGTGEFPSLCKSCNLPSAPTPKTKLIFIFIFCHRCSTISRICSCSYPYDFYALKILVPYFHSSGRGQILLSVFVIPQA